MAIRAIESRFEQLSVNDENEQVNGGGIFHKPKVKFQAKRSLTASINRH